jgi:hypothetical protein
MKKKILGIIVGMLLIATAVPAVESLQNTAKDQLASKNIVCINERATWTQEQKLLASDAAAGDNFSFSLSLSGDTAVIGAYQNDDNGVDSGAAYIFVRDRTTWTEQAKLLALDGTSYDRFGYGVCIEQDTAFIGAPSDNMNRGSVYVFTRSGDTWTQQQKLVTSDGAAGDNFGLFISLDGDTALISATGDENIQGAAYVFTKNDTTWNQQAKLTAADGSAQEYFGQNVCVVENTALIGCPWDNDAGVRSGSSYVFTRSGTTWTQQTKLLASDGDAGDNFGISASMEGDTALIAAPNDDDNGLNSGSAYIFTCTDEVWTEQQKLLATDGAAGDMFGWWSVSLSGTGALIGSMRDDDYGTSSGSAYIFRRTGTTWAQEAKLLASDGEAEDYFGYAVSLDDNIALVGAYLDDDNGTNAGSAYVFNLEGDAPPVAAFIWTPEEPQPNQQVSFDASASYDPDGTVVSYEWDWNSDGIYDETYNSPTTTYLWENSGSYPVTLRVTDDNASTDTITKTVTLGGGSSLEIDITGGFGVKAVITNSGSADVQDIAWRIVVEGGILKMINKTLNGTSDIPAGKSTTVTTGMLLGLGLISISVSVADEEQTASGTQLIIYTLVR